MRTSIARPLAQLGVVVMLAAGLCGCETIASLDPTGLLGGGSAPATDAAPDLAGIPAAPAVPDNQRNVADSLSAAGQQAQYSADALRAGTEAPAPAPGAAAPVTPQVAAAIAASSAPPTASDAPPSASASDAPPTAAPRAPIPVAGNAAPVMAAPTPPPAPAPMVVANPNAAVPAVGSAAGAAPMQVASAAPTASRATAPPPGAEPAVPAVPPPGSVRSSIMAPPVMSDTALGFKPSAAPPLDPSVSNFVAAPILARFRQTAVAGSRVASAVPGAMVSGTDGSVIGAIAASNGGVAPTAVLYFSGDGVTLSAAARGQIRAAVAAFKAGGGTGNVRVVGHASSRTANMPVEKHLELIFEKSQKRANAVAQEMIHEGIPASHVQIDAVGDSQPIYYESMPKGEDGNRRAEIFVQN